MNRDSLSGIARETVRICEAGQYQTATGKPVTVADDVTRAVNDTVLYSATNLPSFQLHRI